MKHLGPVPGWHGYSPKNPPAGPPRIPIQFENMLTRQASDIEARRKLKRS